jgi:nucleotide-binding universal stress UspA family protein
VPREKAGFAFGTIVCAVNRSRGADEAVSQATRLLAPADELTFVAVCDAPGISPAGDMSLSADSATDAVDAACAAASEDGVEARKLVIRGHDVCAALGHVAAGSGLLVLGAHGHAPHGGILLGEVAARAVRDLSVPVLIARSQTEVGFPGMILVGTEGTADRDAVEVAATIAARHDTTVVLGHVRHNGRDLRAELDEQAALVLEITGTEPVIVSVDGDPVARLLAMTRSIGAGLVVLGDHGERSVATVSERIAHRAGSSVLVWRSPAAYTHLHPRTRSTA